MCQSAVKVMDDVVDKAAGWPGLEPFSAKPRSRANHVATRCNAPQTVRDAECDETHQIVSLAWLKRERTNKRPISPTASDTPQSAPQRMEQPTEPISRSRADARMPAARKWCVKLPPPKLDASDVTERPHAQALESRLQAARPRPRTTRATRPDLVAPRFRRRN